ncbi:hypothetical protein [Streptomyces sp. 147326]|uniref:hypothetical protein n=1 Tax=Streptomyces sp. 147326 TaxID=3074379 RepID=UPI003857B373
MKAAADPLEEARKWTRESTKTPALVNDIGALCTPAPRQRQPQLWRTATTPDGEQVTSRGTVCLDDFAARTAFE